MPDSLINRTKSAEQILNRFIDHDKLKNTRQTLTTLFNEWVQSENANNQDQRKEVLFHYTCLMEFLNEAEVLQPEFSIS